MAGWTADVSQDEHSSGKSRRHRDNHLILKSVVFEQLCIEDAIDVPFPLFRLYSDSYGDVGAEP